VLGVVAGGCGGSNDAKREGKTTSTRFAPAVPVTNQKLSEGMGACGLVTQGEVQAAAGSQADAGTGTRTPTNESCRWNLRSGPNQFVSLILSPRGRQQFESAQNQLKGAAEQLNGLGDRAFAASDSAYVLKGEQLVIVEVSTSQPVAARKQAAIKLATGAIPRLKS
jgi:hypothetical protein